MQLQQTDFLWPIKIHAFYLSPKVQSPCHIFFRQIKILCQLPKLTETVAKGTAKVRFCEIIFRSPPIGTVFVSLHKLVWTVYLVESSGSCMTQFVTANTPKYPRGADLGKIQEYGIVSLETDGSTGLRTACIGDHIYPICLAIVVKVRNLKHA